MHKRVLSILLIPIVLICTSGGTIYMEHCGMSKNPSYSLSNEKSCCCSKTMHERCCNQEKIVIKKIDDHFSCTASASIHPLESAIFILPTLYIREISPQFIPYSIYVNNHAPPNASAPLFVLYKSLLI